MNLKTTPSGQSSRQSMIVFFLSHPLTAMNASKATRHHARGQSFTSSCFLPPQALTSKSLMQNLWGLDAEYTEPVRTKNLFCK
jgi:hypothetical protein